MKMITVLCGEAPQNSPFQTLAGYDIRFASNLSEIGETDCLLVSDDWFDLAGAFAEAAKRGLPAAALTDDGTEASLSELLDMGADDVFVMPQPRRLLVRRLEALLAQGKDSSLPVDFAAFERIRVANQGRGAFLVEEHDFENVYRFVMRILERLDKKAQMVIFSFSSPCGPIAETEDVEIFVRIGLACLRRGDICAVVDSQVLLILLGAGSEDGALVVKRLTDTFASHYADATSKITYEMREISG